MDCRQFRSNYSDYADGLLREADEVAFARHLAECAACRRLDAAWRRGIGALRSSPPLRCSPSFAERLDQRLRREVVARPEPVEGLRTFAAVAGALGIVVSASIAGFFWSARQSEPVAVQKVPSVRRYKPGSPIPIPQAMHAHDTLAETDPFRVLPPRDPAAGLQLTAAY